MSPDLGEDYEESIGVERALFAIAIALNNVALQLKYLGNGDAATTMGAIEAFGVVVKEGFESLVSAISDRD